MPAPHVTMVSFGQPRVGNLPFAEDYGALHAHYKSQTSSDVLNVAACPMQLSCLCYHHASVGLLWQCWGHAQRIY